MSPCGPSSAALLDRKCTYVRYIALHIGRQAGRLLGVLRGMCKPWLCDLWSFRAWEGFCFVTSRKRLGEFAHEHIRMIACYVCFAKSVTSFVLYSYGFKTVLICRGSGIAVFLSRWNPFASEGTSQPAQVPFPSQHDSPVVSDYPVAWEFLAFSCIAHTTAKLQFPFLFGEPEPEPAVGLLHRP